MFNLGRPGVDGRAMHPGVEFYMARSDAGLRAVDDLTGQPLLAPRRGQPVVETGSLVYEWCDLKRLSRRWADRIGGCVWTRPCGA